MSNLDPSEISPSKSKFNLKLCIYISLANFVSMMAWSLYNSNVNISLNAILQSPAIVGFLMVMDNIIALIISPIVASKSDAKRTRFGRRMPYLMVFIPISSIFFAIIPFVDQNLISLLVVMFLFNISMACFRPQTFALLPDLIEEEHRSKGNGIVNLFGGLGAVFVFILGGILLDTIYWLSWVIVSILMNFALLIMIKKIREPKIYTDLKDESDKINILESIKMIFQSQNKQIILILLVIFLAYSGYNALESLWATYAEAYLGLERGEATFSLVFVGLFVLLFSIPSGIIALKIGKKITTLIGLIIGSISVILCNFLTNILLIQILFIIFGICWAMINVNTIAIVWEMAPSKDNLGIYSGLYYFASSGAAIFGPFVIGVILEYIFGNTSYQGLFLVSTFLFISATIILLFFRNPKEIDES